MKSQRGSQHMNINRGDAVMKVTGAELGSVIGLSLFSSSCKDALVLLG